MAEADSLTTAQEALIGLSAALATRDAERIAAVLRSTAATAAAVEIDEVILQSHLFVGFPDALNALLLWRELSGPHAPGEDPEDPARWEQRGERVCARVYGSNYGRLRANVAGLHPDLDRWVVVGGYGRVIGRPMLDLCTRELCIVALLSVWNVPRQLHSHLRGALHVGATLAQVDRALEIAGRYLPACRQPAIAALWGEVRATGLRP
jgi:4-carboxymuconolactone decarboxylase